ncbi:electron transport complex subunit RsxG [Uliginosibacterium sp. 31-16]|uniref:electron transport complex subunit RsxG n=1 Tax=Uliginosibacterium sp. 31-16 TaxID=3068315 RepID=UPI00273F8065|nr:electron transport complex subunit RsxG [Uliginosibacterium sp. 31-16]MDP5240670.1 electron transport complex subunit RsxG [Uliginosibacterium sp. 31-16]
MSEQNLPQPSPLKLSASTAGVMLLFTLVFTGLMAGTYELTRDTIAASAEAEQLRLINEILPPAGYDNALLQDVKILGSTPELGLPKGGKVWRARKAGQPAALVFETVAPDGYAGAVRLVIAVSADGTLGGVRVTEHHETPGLGDYIDPKKDKNKAEPWIAQFVGKTLTTLPLERWKVKKDGGDFVYRTGATISARAVTNAVARTVAYAHAQRDALYQ